MSGAASEGKGGAKKKAAAPEKESEKTEKVEKAEKAEAKAADQKPAEEPGPQVESQGDRFETLMTYDPKSKVPFVVVLVWACALIGLGTYTVTLYFPDLALWGSP